MRSVVRTLVLVVVAVVLLTAGFVGGWYARPSGGSNNSGSSGSSTLSVIAAGSLAPILPSFISAFANATPGVSAPTAAQLYEGSTAAATTLAGGDQPYNAFLSADFRVIPQHLEPSASTIASWEVVFAADPVVLAYSPSVSALSGINSTNWATKITQSGVTLGVPNASSDPLGENAIFVLELEDAAAGMGGALYSHFFNGAMGALATPTSSALYVSENVASTALSTGQVSTFLIYQSYAKVDGLHYISLEPNVNLGATDSASVAHYGTVTTTVLSGTSTKTVKGAPVLFALTVPSSTTNYTLSLSFAAYLLSNATATLWSNDGFVPLPSEWTDQPGHLPAALAGSPPGGVEALPAYLAALLA